ncbi:MAG TPA: DNA-processing protein DprA, partial [Anaerolineales bacterium]|nr:DNA-processing protein DprA [Anaerolineales bacterium]
MRITDEKKFWIAFSYVRGFGAVRILKLVEYFGSLQDAWNSQIGDLAQAGISKKNIENLINFRAKMNPDLLVENIIKSRIEVYFSDDNDYPQRLTEIEQKPPVLYYRGAITQSDVLSIGIVG